MGIFRKGIPTKHDVEALTKAIDPERGTSVSQEDIAKIIGSAIGTHRFGTVCYAWRDKLFREYGIQTKAFGGRVHFLTQAESMSEGVIGMKRIARRADRTTERIGAIDTSDFDEKDRSRHMILARYATAVTQASRDACRAIAEKPERKMQHGALRIAPRSTE